MHITPTITQFCHQTWQLEASIQLTKLTEEHFYVVTDTTPFHPVSHIWPDHPADKGTLNGYIVQDCQVGAVDTESGELYVGQTIPVKRDEAGWVFVTVHCLSADCSDLTLGQRVSLSVDKEYQLSLSRGHSAGHLSYLALNKVLTERGYWRKDADRKDPHGNYDFNSYAQVTSFVTPDKCLDTYRLGKTLRKRGLNSADMLSDLSHIEQQVNEQLINWLELNSDIKVECDGEALTDSRYWQCDLKESAMAVIPCGGTHASSLAEYLAIEVSLLHVDEQNIEMHTYVKPA
ncbi:alanyl-tRNA editing protein [Vibrio europaeus]|uniref:Alanyl-tRNA editing protein n=1 Tax=Vibrio europaeus TaxID=300876 RepID=A0AAE7DVF2_9VIBR|nr:alanyl-tRNA editing protein [Vibrio europaeus]MDC5810285.1 alanyl-tRNA editing protein [Vibrio europaeus]QJY35454.1 alanyl-tRNA editing protein [Vibrio europaeus]QPG37073.1 alanyl-tRNA editing protein [Vibrio europaeus]